MLARVMETFFFFFTAELTWRRWELAFASWTGTSETAEALRRIIDAGAPI